MLQIQNPFNLVKCLSILKEWKLIYSVKLAEQQKNERAGKIQNVILKQTHDNKLAEGFKRITKKTEGMYKSI